MKQKFQIIKKDEIDRVVKSVGKKIKESSLISGDWCAVYAIATVVIDNVKSKAEVHENAADVFKVLKGKGKIVLGGKLKKPKIIKKGELIGESIESGIEYQITKGDVINIPFGVPHQFKVEEGRLGLLIIKINQKYQLAQFD